MSGRRELGTLASLCVGVVLLGSFPYGGSANAQSTVQTGQWPPPGNFQRSIEAYNLKTIAPSGWQRGEEIYYYSCWYCHNQYTVAAGTTPAPAIKDLYKRTTLATGKPVNDQTVSEIIRDGSPGMPAYRHSLTDDDLADLVSYLREGKCCFEGEEPPRNPRYRGIPASPPEGSGPQALRGGPRGIVRLAAGNPLEGIMVQLISQKTAIRTTVFSNEAGRYEFPKLEPGLHTLRIARPLAFRPYQKDSIRIDDGRLLEDIVLERVTSAALLPPTAEIAAQLTLEERMLNFSGTGEEKMEFRNSCWKCHSSRLEIFRGRFDERSWRLIVNRMVTGQGGKLLRNRRAGAPFKRLPPKAEKVAQWLTRVRGPEAKEAPFRVLPRPTGPSTRIVVTEYEVPRRLLDLYQARGDSEGNIWYASHSTQYVGKLNPRTGIVTEYRVPPATTGALPGTHRVEIDKNGIVWFSQPWSGTLARLDPRTGQVTHRRVEMDRSINEVGLTQYGLAPDGTIWFQPKGLTDEQGRGTLAQLDPNTGKILKQYSFSEISEIGDHLISKDGRYWAGAELPGDLIGLLDIPTGQYWEIPTLTPMSNIHRGEFDMEGNAWFAAGVGALIKLDAKTRQVKEYFPPNPAYYPAIAVDKNGEVWGTDDERGRVVRFNPRTERWIQYALPEPYAKSSRVWIDNSADPIAVWYLDAAGFIVRVQPLE